MPGGFYRDAEAAIRARLIELQEVVRYRESQVAAHVVPFLPVEVGDALERARDDARATPTDYASVQRLVLALESLSDVLARVLALQPGIEGELRAIPAEAPPPPRFAEPHLNALVNSVVGGWDFRPVEDAFTQLLTNADRDAKVSLENGHELTASFSVRNVPFSLRYRVALREAVLSNDGFPGAWVAPLAGDYMLCTSAAVGAPELTLTPQLLRHTVGKWLHLVSDIELGDPDIDTAFLVRGSAATARRVVTGRVREKLIAFCRSDVPRFEVRPGSITLAWHFETDGALLALGAEILHFARALTPRP